MGFGFGAIPRVNMAKLGGFFPGKSKQIENKIGYAIIGNKSGLLKNFHFNLLKFINPTVILHKKGRYYYD
jgi:hypothetical protein